MAFFVIIFICYKKLGVEEKMAKKVIIPKEFAHYLGEPLRDYGFEVVELEDQYADSLLQHKDADGMVINATPLSNDTIDQMPKLKVIARFGVGYDNVDLNHCKERGIYVTNTPGGNEVAVAECAVTDILILSKNLYTVSQKMREGDDSYAFHHPSHDIKGKTIGIVGYGNIGQQAAKMLSGFGVKTLIWNRSPKTSEYGEFVEWDELFKRSDFVSLHLPAVKGTIGSVNKDTFKMMKNSAFIVNFARGAVINEQDMIEALKSGEIAGAGLDVFEKEPLPMDSELRKLPNVFMTPHNSGFSVESFTKISNMASSEVNHVLKGEKPEHCVNGLD